MEYTIRTDDSLQEGIQAGSPDEAVKIFTNGHHATVDSFFDSIPVDDGAFAWIEADGVRVAIVGRAH